jgi:hypothetical protein
MKTLREARMGWVFSVAPVLLFLSGCAPTPPASDLRGSFKPVVTLNQVMVGVVDHNSHILWNAGGSDAYAPASDADWHELEHAAITLAAVGNTILIGGSGPDDLAWTQKPDWAKLTQGETDAALALLLAVQHKNRDELFKAGSELTEKCEACHKEYKPALPAIIATPEEQPEHFYGAKSKKK